MTTKELIKRLLKYPEDAELKIDGVFAGIF